MSFSDLAALDGMERIIRCDISLDGFATVAYRYADRAGRYDATNWWERRIPLSTGLAAVRRAFGRDRIAASATTSLQLENADGGVDWICGRGGIASAAQARFRLYVGLFVPTSAPPAVADIQWKLLGEFTCSEWPRHDNETVTIQLGDDLLGRLGAGLRLPTFSDWMAVGTLSNNPLKQGVGLPSSITEDTPIQLAFGEDFLLALPHVIAWGNSGSGDAYAGRIIVPLCTTADLSPVTQDLVTLVRAEMVPQPQSFEDVPQGTAFVDVPRTVTDLNLNSLTVWRVEKSPTITIAGKNLQIVYLVMHPALGQVNGAVQDPDHPEGFAQWYAKLSDLKYQGGYPPDAIDSIAKPASTDGVDDYNTMASRVVRWWVQGRLSAKTGSRMWLDIVHSVDAMTDLVSEYSSATIDATAAARVKAGAPFSSCFGVVQAWTEKANKDASGDPLPLSLRQVLTALAQSADVDIFANWAGQISFSSDVYDYAVATGLASLLELRESEVRVERWVPAAGERGAAFNRVYFEGGKAEPARFQDVPFQGPYDIAAAELPISARVVEAIFQQGWRPFRQQSANPLRWRNIDARVRDRVQITTHRGALRLELGDYFKLTWTRGSSIGGPYAGAVFQCEALTYNPGDDSVQIEALWRDDVQTERSYLLDDESLLVRAKTGSDSMLLFVSGGVIFAGLSFPLFNAMGVQGGDLLVLRDSTQAADDFTRNRAIRIDYVDDDYTLVLISTDTSGIPTFPSTVTVANADWSIVRGATTYPTAISHPGAYPDGGAIYGKVTQVGGTTSDAATGNRLING